MIFFAMLMLFFAAIVFFHYIQGFFSSALSAIFAVIAAVLAFSYHETIVESFLGGRMADYAHALVLLALFATIYLVLRIIFDSAISGNVRMPATIDKVGAVLMGAIAGVFATGIVAIAAEEMPFTGSIAGYARHDVQGDRAVTVPAARNLDRHEWDELNQTEPGKWAEDSHGVPILPMDDIVVGAVQKMSDGSLSAGKPLNSVHPNFLDELFGQRIGIEPGANHVAMNLPEKKLEAMDVVGIYTTTIPPAKQEDGELKNLRSPGALKPIALSANETFLVVRVMFKPQAADLKDRLIRFSPASVHLVVNEVPPGGTTPVPEDVYPVGTLQAAKTLYLNKLDDYLFISSSDGDKGADLVFRVNKKQFEKKVPPGTLIDFKRLARVDLSGMEIKPQVALKPSTDVDVMRKTMILAPPPPPEETVAVAPPPPPPDTTPTPAPTPTPTPTPGTPAPAPAGAFDVHNFSINDSLPAPITAPTTANGTLVQVPGGTAVIASGKLKVGNIDSTPAEQNQPQKVVQFAVPEGQVMVQITAVPASGAPWGIATEPDQYELVDSTGKKYQPNGVFAAYDAGGKPRMYLRYIDASSISGSAAPDNAGAPKSVTLVYLIPPATTLTELDDHGQKVKDIPLTTK